MWRWRVARGVPGRFSRWKSRKLIKIQEIDKSGALGWMAGAWWLGGWASWPHVGIMLAQGGSRWPQVGSSWPRVGSSWAQVGSSWPHVGLKLGQEPILEASWSCRSLKKPIKPMVFHRFFIDQPGCAKPAAGQPASHVDPETWLGWTGPRDLSHITLLLTGAMDFKHFCASTAGQVSMSMSCFGICAGICAAYIYGVSQVFPGDMRRYMRRIFLRCFLEFRYAPLYAPHIYIYIYIYIYAISRC